VTDARPEEILPCPFCGCSGALLDHEPVDSVGYWGVTCDECDASGPQVYGRSNCEQSQVDAIEQWNRGAKAPVTERPPAASSEVMADDHCSLIGSRTKVTHEHELLLGSRAILALLRRTQQVPDGAEVTVHVSSHCDPGDELELEEVVKPARELGAQQFVRVRWTVSEEK